MAESADEKAESRRKKKIKSEPEADDQDEEEEEEVVKKPAEKAKKMSLTKEERVGIILLCGSRSLRQTAEDFNKANPKREKITHSCVSKLLAKFRETGSILDKPHVAKKRVTDETTSAYILAKFSLNPSSSIRRMALETNVSKTSIRRILRANRVVTTSTIGAPITHPYHHLNTGTTTTNNNNNNNSNASNNYNYGEFGSANNGYSDNPTAPKKKPARPRKSKSAIAAATAAANDMLNASTATTATIQNSNADINNHQLSANKWQQMPHQHQHVQHHQDQQQQNSSGVAVHGSFDHMNAAGHQMMPGDYMATVATSPSVLKSPKAHKGAVVPPGGGGSGGGNNNVGAAVGNSWNAPSVGYGYGAPLLYPSGIGYIDPVTQ